MLAVGASWVIAAVLSGARGRWAGILLWFGCFLCAPVPRRTGDLLAAPSLRLVRRGVRSVVPAIRDVFGIPGARRRVSLMLRTSSRRRWWKIRSTLILRLRRGRLSGPGRYRRRRSPVPIGILVRHELVGVRRIGRFQNV